MTNHRGFSLTEVLVALILVSSAALTFLRQQWQLSQTVNQTLNYAKNLVQLDNLREKMMERERLQLK